MLVQDIMTKEVVTIDFNETVVNTCMKYRDKKVGCLVVTKEKQCVGIITERDLIERVICLHKDPEKTKINEIMTHNIITIHRLDQVEKALEILKEYKIKKLPVISNGVLVGIVTISDMATAEPEMTREFMDKWINARWEIT